MKPEPAPAPHTLINYWCDACGVFKQHNPFKHYAWGKLCKGTIYTVLYRREPSDINDFYRQTAAAMSIVEDRIRSGLFHGEDVKLLAQLTDTAQTLLNAGLQFRTERRESRHP